MLTDPLMLNAFLKRLLHGQVPAEEVDQWMADAESVDVLYEHMVASQKAAELRVATIKAGIHEKHTETAMNGGNIAHQEFYAYRQARNQELLATKAFLSYLQAEMPRWRRARQAHRDRVRAAQQAEQHQETVIA